MDILKWKEQAQLDSINTARNPESVNEESYDDEELESSKINEISSNIIEALNFLDQICQCLALDEETLLMIDGT